MILLFFLYIFTYHTISVDGDLRDFEENERVLQDKRGDSFWGTQNEIYDLYITWDKNNLYLGLSYIVKNNALLIVIDAGIPGAEDLDILNWYPRNIKLNGMNANYIVALWDADLSKGGFRKIYFNGLTTDLTSKIDIINSGSSGEISYIEAKIPFNLIFNEGFKSGAKIKIFSCIAGGDHSGSGDVSPDNSDVDGLAPEYIRRFLVVEFDKNYDAIPDSGVNPIDNSHIEEARFEKLEVKNFEIDKENLLVGENVECKIKISKTSNLNLFLITEEGKLYKKIFQGTVPKEQEKTFKFNIQKPGIYILTLQIPGKLRKNRVLKVVK